MQVLYETSLADYLCYKVTAPVVEHKKHLTRICLSAKITQSCASQMRREFCPLCWSSFPKGRSTLVLPPSFTDLETTSKELHWSSAALSRNEEIPNALLGGDSSLSAMHSFPALAGTLCQYAYRWSHCLQDPLSQKRCIIWELTRSILLISAEKTTKIKL